tara:strand:+ start:3737 stop:4585 length:849 start_codon:yes stop_codon:yes gene_type:complete
MADNFISVNFRVSPIYPGVEILIAELSLLEFEMFEEIESGLIAYIHSRNFNKKTLSKIKLLKSSEFNITYYIQTIEDKNWNKEWEKNFDKVKIGDNCVIRAPFHKASKKEYEIVIMPEMSFGTGHHETTQLMIENILDSDLTGLNVCDVGSGTGILSILSEKKGAKRVDAVDIDLRCCKNSLENLKRNKCSKVYVQHSSSDILLQNKYDLILCNINLNHLIDNFQNFDKISIQNTHLIVSGFYKNDLDQVNAELKKNNFDFIDFIEKNNWVSSKYCYNLIPH